MYKINIFVLVLALSLTFVLADDANDGFDDAALADAIALAGIGGNGNGNGNGNDEASRKTDSDSNDSSSITSNIISNGASGNGDSGSSSVSATPSSPFASLPRLGGNLLERFRNFNLVGRFRTFNERARQFREGIQVNPDSLAYRTGRRISLTVQSLGQRAREWSERYRQRQLAAGATVDSTSNSISS